MNGHTIPTIGIPYLYLLCEKNSKLPFYIGEYGKSETYNVVTRIKKHFSNAGTLSRVSINLTFFGYPIPTSFDAYIKKLPEEFKNTCNRESLEAWVIHKVCHQHKMQDEKFCVTKYIAPRHDYSKCAQDIIDEFNKLA